MRFSELSLTAPPLGPEGGSGAAGIIPVDLGDETARDRADDDGMATVVPPAAADVSDSTGAQLAELHELSTHGGERDALSLGRFQETVAALRARPGATGAFRAKMASAAGWAALLFSSWRHLKYDRPTITGADRVRNFITRDLEDARRLHRRGDGGSAHDSERRVRGQG
jgi:hypothetical protein